MSEGQSVASVATCSPSTSGTDRGDGNTRSGENTHTARIPRLCVNEVPWKIVPQKYECEVEYDFLDEDENRLSDVESFVWKWSPCGRYGIDMSGGRDVINQQLKDRMAVFDLHTNSWSMYVMDHPPSEIPRVCFIYWARDDMIVIVSLLKDHETGPDDDVCMKFKQSFYLIDHDEQSLSHLGKCKYSTNKSIVASYWYHIFENRRGEPFIDHENNAWLVFSNGKDCLILLPYIPTMCCTHARCIEFDMDKIMSNFIDKQVFLDPFVSSHFVPWVYKNDINFFIRIDERSFSEHRDYVYEEEVSDVESLEKCGMYHLRINLKDVIAKSKKTNQYDDEEPRSWATFDRNDVELFRKISDDSRHAQECMTQHGKTVVITKWDSYSLHLGLSRALNTRVCDSHIRNRSCCSSDPRDYSFCAIDLDNEQIKKFDTLILGTDVILPHPNGQMFMFNYKEYYAMRFCELPYFQPLSLQLKCQQAISGCVEIDEYYYETECCLNSALFRTYESDDDEETDFID